jgi:hypothetical protein
MIAATIFLNGHITFWTFLKIHELNFFNGYYAQIKKKTNLPILVPLWFMN